MPTTTKQVGDFIKPPTKLNYIVKNTQKYFLLLLILLLVLLGIFGWFFYKKTINFFTKNETQVLVEKVGKLVILPQDEIPTIAKVSNPELLKDQAFFMEAKMGDVVLIYTNAKKAILYDPVVNKIINISNINIGDTKKTIELPVKSKNIDTKTTDSSSENQF